MRRLKSRARLAALALAGLALSTHFARPAALSAPGGGTVRAMAIGIDDYPNLSSGLRGALADAKDIYQALQADGVEDVTLVTDREATRARIISEMDRLVASSRAGDLVIVTYAGHGMQVPEYPRWQGIDPNGVNEVIALSNYSFKGPGANEVIVNEEVRAWLSRLNAKSVDTLVVWDSCFGGGMRSIPNGIEMRVRRIDPPPETRLLGAPEQEQRRKFPGIAMTEKEARADVKAMPHVTFLAGADASSVVPEMTGIDPKNPSVLRGALSYYFARALEGAAEPGPVARDALYKFLKQHVRQATVDRQALQVDPQSRDLAVSGKAVFIVSDAAPPPPAPPKDAVGLWIKDGPPDAFASIEKGSTALFPVKDPSVAELIWNVPEREAIEKGDVIMHNVDGSMIGAIADRVRALSRLRAVSEGRPLTVRIETGGEALVPGEEGSLAIDDLHGQHLVVFNIAADATVQMLYPSAPSESGRCDDPGPDRWHCNLRVTPPFGVDAIVALATSQDLGPILKWLREHHGQRDAAAVPDLFDRIASLDKQARVGFVAVVTAAKK